VSRFTFTDERIKHWAAQAPERTAMTASSGAKWTYAELDRAVEAGVKEIAALGLEPGELIALTVPHTAETAIRILSVLRSGMTGVVLDSRQKPAELERKLQALPFSAIWSRDGFKLRADRSLDAKLEIERLNACWVLQTSGSSGDPKAVLLDESNLRERARGETAAFALEPGGALVNVLTFAHDLGLNQLLTSVDSGSTLHVVSMPSIAEIVHRMKQAGRPGVTGTPHLWREFLAGVREGISIAGLEPKFLTVSGGSLDAQCLAALGELFPRARVIRTYGQTETFRTTIDGFPIAGVQAELLATGELVHRGAGEMLGYLLDPVATAEKKAPGGGIATGDFFERSSSGELVFKGRIDELIKRDDFRVSLFEIEAEIRNCAGVGEAAVIEADGDLIAFVTANSGVALNEMALFAALRERMSGYKIPDSLIVTKSLPRTAIGKVNKPELKKNWTGGRS
jgi:long-chain acyl-CoA synthetase